MMVDKTPTGGSLVAISASETRAWANRFGATWPCSKLAGRTVHATFDKRGDLVELELDRGKGDQDTPCDEFDALMAYFAGAMSRDLMLGG